jgi:hypothetical protein
MITEIRIVTNGQLPRLRRIGLAGNRLRTVEKLRAVIPKDAVIEWSN